MKGGCGKDKKVPIMGVLENKLGPMEYRDGMETLSMVALIVGRTCSDVVIPFGS